jgi:hypothetical protein
MRAGQLNFVPNRGLAGSLGPGLIEQVGRRWQMKPALGCDVLLDR